MAKWSVASADSGILRKKPPEKHEELLVFGYACKLFRDDEKALYIDQGKHLIPWMGDSKLKIDRYDGRGALSELSSCEASREGYDATRWLGLSETERRIEQLCDEERYYSLHINEEEEELYKEEEAKRLQQKSNEFQYSYDVPQKTEIKTEGPQMQEECPTVEEKPFVPPPQLDVPVDIAIPKTNKENLRIEKTAFFVSQQGLQMEILIKAKQADNPQFSFLNKDDVLYAYYRHMLSAIKNGTYKVQTEIEKEEKKEEAAAAELHEESYLHPSLQPTSAQSAVQPPPLPAIPYKPSADCAYSQLVNRIQGTTQADSKPEVQPQMTYEQQQQYYQYYYASQYYEYYKQMAQYQSGEAAECNGDVSQANANVKPQNFDQNQYLNFAQFAYAQYMQQHQNPANPYAQIVSNLNKDNPYAAFMENIQQNNGDISKAPIIYSNQTDNNTPEVQKVTPLNFETNQEIPAQNNSTAVQNNLKSEPLKPLKATEKPLLPLVQYDSDDDSDGTTSSDNEDEKREETPPEEMQVVIDKMASYVSKNGADFETIVKSKGDARFEFLNDSHKFYGYYKRKLQEYLKEKDGSCKADVPVQNKVKPKKVIAPVSFSIKKPKEEPPSQIKSALPLEESSDEDEQQQDQPTTSAPVPTATPVPTPPANPIPPPAIQIPPSANQNPPPANQNPPPANQNPPPANQNPPLANLNPPPANPIPPPVPSTAPGTPPTAPPAPPQPSAAVMEAVKAKCNEILERKAEEREREREKAAVEVAEFKNGILDGDDPILEMIDLTGELEDRRDARRAEDRIKDKLAMAAREKLASVSRDRALQLERRKKAAAFLKLKSAESSQPEVAKSPETNSKSEEKPEKKIAEPKIDPEIVSVQDDSELEEGEVKKHKSKRKKSHKRKHSKSKHESRSRKKAKKRRKRSRSRGSESSLTS